MVKIYLYREKHVHIAPGIGFLRTGENRKTPREKPLGATEKRENTPSTCLILVQSEKNVLLRTIIVLSVMPR